MKDCSTTCVRSIVSNNPKKDDGSSGDDSFPHKEEDLASQILQKALKRRPIRQLENRLANAADHQQRRQQWERGETSDVISWAIFETQQDAFNAIDKVYRNFISRVSDVKDLPTKGTDSHAILVPPPLKVFSFESGIDGRRRFLVASVEEFWLRYIKLAPIVRHFYEVIREDTPVLLYFDLEFARNPHMNANVDGDQLVGLLLYKVSQALFRIHGIRGLSYKNVIHLDSSTSTKFSRHLVIHLPNGEMFRDVAHVKAFVLGIVEQLKTEPDSEKLWLDKEEHLHTEGAVKEEGLTKKTFFADLGVYTRNRVFRMLLSSKFGKQAILLPSTSNQFNALSLQSVVNEHDKTYWITGASSSSSSSTPKALSLMDEKKLWEASLITGAQPPLPPMWFERELQLAMIEARAASSNSNKRPRDEILDDDENSAFHPRLNFRLLHEKIAHSNSTSSSSLIHPTQSVDQTSSSLSTSPQPRPSVNKTAPDDIVIEGGRTPPPFPTLVKFVLFLALGPIDTQLASFDSIENIGSIPASVRTWTAIARNIQVELPQESSSTTSSFSPTSSSSSSSSTTTTTIKTIRVISKLTLNISGSRYCNSIGRHHKSNGVFWTINLTDGGSLRQGCFDTDCKKLESRVVQIPLSLLPDQLPEGARVVVTSC